MGIGENVKRIMSGLRPGVVLLAASKGQPLGAVMEAIEAGVKVIGENYVQEAAEKFGSRGELIRGMAELHMIGHLQRRNVKTAIKLFDVVQGVGSIEVARQISRRAESKFRIFIEVNIAGEDSKSGFMPEEAESAALEISRLPNIVLEGMMTMPMANSEEELRMHFRRARVLFERIRENVPTFKHLSMGMSSDYKMAVEEGSTMVRIGTLIFGERKK